MNTGMVYAINSGKVVSETIEGETIIINLENGNYYSMNESGSLFWQCIQQGASLESILARFIARYEAAPKTIEEALRTLIEFLTTEGLIVESAEAETAMVPPAEQKRPFETPSIQRYDDMQEMLLADPIHDVDSVGWPTLKQA